MAADRSPLTLVDDGRVDRDALDAAAALAVAGLVVDLAGAEQRAVQRRRDAVRRRLALVAVAAAVILLSFTLTPAATLVPPLPASVPSGPATLPRTVEQAPQWIPTADRDPLGRAIYVLQTDLLTVGQDAVETTYGGPVLVGADGAGYRRLPGAGQVLAVALSPDGRRVGWVADGDDVTEVKVLDLRTGRTRSGVLPSAFGRGVAVSALAFSPDGARLAVGGTELFGGGPGQPAVFVLDADSASVQQECHGCGDGALAWSAAGSVLVTEGSPLVRNGGGFMPAAENSGLGATRLDALRPPAVVSAGGDLRWWVTDKASDGQEVPLVLRRTGGGQPVREVADLGTWLGAVALADTRRGVLVSRWRAGGGELVAVGDTGRTTLRDAGPVDLLTRSSGPAVVAVASGLLAEAVPGAGPTAPQEWRSLAWYRWQTVQLWRGLPSGWWLAPLLLLLVPAVRRRLAGPGHAVLAVHRRTAGSTVAVVGLAVIGAGGVLTGTLVLPTQAAPVEPGEARSPVLPESLQLQSLLPPRAFDQAGEPRTRRISLMFSATLGGNPRLLGVDADTGTLVRLDDLPGVPGSGEATMFAVSGAQSGGISPNGRFVALGPLVIDLQTATARKVAEAGESTGGAAVTDDGTLLAVVPGTKNRITIARPGEPGRTLEGSEGTFSLEPSADGYVVARFLGSTSDQPEALVDVIDPVGRRYLGRLARVEQSVPVTVVGGEPGGAAPTVVRIDPTTGTVLAGTRQVRAPGSVERLTGGLGGGLVALGYGGPGAPDAVLRSEPGEDRLLPLTRLDWPGVRVQDVVAAAGVVSQARVLEVAPPRWDSWFRWRGELVVLGILLLAWGALVAVDRLPVRVAPRGPARR